MERTEHHFGTFWEKDLGGLTGGPSSLGPFVLLLKTGVNTCRIPGDFSGPRSGKGGQYERGLFTREISRISKICKFSRISKKWSDSSSFCRCLGFSRISRFSRKGTFLMYLHAENLYRINS